MPFDQHNQHRMYKYRATSYVKIETQKGTHRTNVVLLSASRNILLNY